MTTSIAELEKIAALAYIETDANSAAHFAKHVGDIMDFVEALRQVDTTAIEPLLHPLDIQQRLRSDEILATNQVATLEKIAPLFADGLYLVPKVIDTGK